MWSNPSKQTTKSTKTSCLISSVNILTGTFSLDLGENADINSDDMFEVLIGAHHILHLDYDFSRAEASYGLTNFADTQRVHWYAEPGDPDVREDLDIAGEHNIDGWDGYYVHVAWATSVMTVVGLDDDFERIAGFSVEIPLTADERAALYEYLAPTSEE